MILDCMPATLRSHGRVAPITRAAAIRWAARERDAAVWRCGAAKVATELAELWGSALAFPLRSARPGARLAALHRRLSAARTGEPEDLSGQLTGCLVVLGLPG